MSVRLPTRAFKLSTEPQATDMSISEDYEFFLGQMMMKFDFPVHIVGLSCVGIVTFHCKWHIEGMC